MKVLYYLAGFVIATAIYGLIIFVIYQLEYQPRGIGWILGWVALIGVAKAKVKSLVEGVPASDENSSDSKEEKED
jgi:hypothetical protein